ncbi:MAG: hypothetical protein C0523_03965 [Cytophaga sp.]|nr:hypothetical protein [Cytophaga sp.]
MKKKRLAVIGGGAHTIPSYRAMLKRIAHKYEVILFSEFHLDRKSEVEEYSIRSVSEKKRNARWRTVAFFILIIKSFYSQRPDLIHSHSTYPSGVVAIILGWLFRIPVVVCLDAAEASAVPEIQFGDLLHKRRMQWNKWVMKNAAAVTALTRFQCDDVRVNSDFSKPIQIIPRGVDLARYMPTDKAPIAAPVRFLSVAYLHPVKDHDTLLRAFQMISHHVEASLTIVGQDYSNGRMQQLAKELGIQERVDFTGFVPHENIAGYYKQADILLHTALFESQAMAVVEAMACGVLVCGTRVGIMADLSGECCVTVTTKEYATLADEVVRLINSPAEQIRLRANARNWVETHSLSWTTQQYLNLYEQVIK